ncbi:DUF4376 domain-containing protein [Novosphingobium mangrovi (ex Hu et al. 2023)]|uniref:DUF4376 domain-containing protein n=1 Tax=Novosphingobium mangrovi (ex Hu et al. 2023) TaxID=2930094 RepID=A0ABT0A8X3_9SPHN|nr:DUF4376 domain-containing protein [Novosphingobium mangrovi (ex Hu et al. 2023)]MCJ1959644.1 DUF4376 domain-containing protein [Novosphingobium mangrovi (ex Hu et al. 2023)]
MMYAIGKRGQAPRIWACELPTGGEPWFETSEDDDLQDRVIEADAIDDSLVISRDEPWALEVSLPLLRARRWEKAKAIRDARINGGCQTPLGVVDTDPQSRLNIAGAVSGALLAQQAGADFAEVWTLRDNSTVTIDAAAMIALGQSVLAHVSACHAAGSAIRTALERAGNVEELDAVDLTSAYPPEILI